MSEVPHSVAPCEDFTEFEQEHSKRCPCCKAKFIESRLQGTGPYKQWLILDYFCGGSVAVRVWHGKPAGCYFDWAVCCRNYTAIGVAYGCFFPNDYSGE